MTEKPLCNISVRGHMFCFFSFHLKNCDWTDNRRNMETVLGVWRFSDGKKTSLQTSCPDLAEFSAECKDSISPSIMAASKHSCRSLKPLTWRGYCPNISVFSNFFPVNTHMLTSLTLNTLCNVLRIMIISYLIHVITLFSGHHMDTPQWKYVIHKGK